MMKSFGSAVLATGVLALLSVASPAAAKPPSGSACTADMKKFCGDVAGGGAKLKCLKDHQGQLSEPCKKQLETEEVTRGAGPCRADIDKFCKGLPLGGGRIRECLQQHTAELSPECKKHVPAPRAQ